MKRKEEECWNSMEQTMCDDELCKYDLEKKGYLGMKCDEIGIRRNAKRENEATRDIAT